MSYLSGSAPSFVERRMCGIVSQRHCRLLCRIWVEEKSIHGWEGMTLISLFPILSNLHSSAYLLAAAALSPLYAKLSDMIGRKPILFGCIVVFLVSVVSCSPITFTYFIYRLVLHYVVLHKQWFGWWFAVQFKE